MLSITGRKVFPENGGLVGREPEKCSAWAPTFREWVLTLDLSARALPVVIVAAELLAAEVVSF